MQELLKAGAMALRACSFQGDGRVFYAPLSDGLCMQALLQEGMQELLKTASDTTALEPWPCVHALNALCQAFNDKHLALDISGFCAEGEQIHAQRALHERCQVDGS